MGLEWVDMYGGGAEGVGSGMVGVGAARKEISSLRRPPPLQPILPPSSVPIRICIDSVLELSVRTSVTGLDVEMGGGWVGGRHDLCRG